MDEKVPEKRERTDAKGGWSSPTGHLLVKARGGRLRLCWSVHPGSSSFSIICHEKCRFSTHRRPIELEFLKIGLSPAHSHAPKSLRIRGLGENISSKWAHLRLSKVYIISESEWTLVRQGFAGA